MDDIQSKTKWILDVKSDLLENCLSAKQLAIAKIDNHKMSIFKTILLDTHPKATLFCNGNSPLNLIGGLD